MAFQEGVLLRNAKLNAINTNLGGTATLKVFSGAEPVNCAAADPSGATRDHQPSCKPVCCG